MTMSDNAQYRELFVQEATEHVESLNEYLLKLEQEPNVKEHIDILFRSAHTLKGMSATMGYDQIKELCKAIENEFDKFRKDESVLSNDMASVLFSCVDAIKLLITDEKHTIDLEVYLSAIKNPESSTLSSLDESTSTSSSTIRVKMDSLDSIVNLIGELMISKMRLSQTLDNVMSDESRQVLMSFDKIITDLHYKMMKVRLVPIDHIFNRFPRMIRDLSNSQNKKVDLKMDGMGIELDRTILDAISDPLLHMIRNSVDHGLETPQERKKNKKSEIGNLSLTASHSGDRVEITIQDDGRGIDVEAIKKKAVEKQIITEDNAQKMSDKDVVGLLGTPGLSSAKEVTDVSGRGVGMNVVFSQVEKVGGNVKISTTKGKGTKIILGIPLSLAIIGGLLVKIGQEKFVIPISTIVTTVKVPPQDLLDINGSKVFRLNDEIIPIVKIDEILGIKSSNSDDVLTIVIVERDGAKHGLVIDSFDKKQEIVIKKLDTNLYETQLFSDATILPDGGVALILDPSLLLTSV